MKHFIKEQMKIKPSIEKIKVIDVYNFQPVFRIRFVSASRIRIRFMKQIQVEKTIGYSNINLPKLQEYHIFQKEIKMKRTQSLVPTISEVDPIRDSGHEW